MTGKDICIFIEKHHLEEVDDIVFDDPTISFNITFESGDCLMYSLHPDYSLPACPDTRFDFGKGVKEYVVFWPGPKNCLKTGIEISFEDAMKMREAGKATDEYLIDYI